MRDSERIKKTPTLTAKRARELFEYKDGVLYWIKSKGRIKAGAIAGAIKGPYGYQKIWADGGQYYRSRIVFLMHHGRWPVPTCDHINRDVRDDRIENLREATRSLQGRNKNVRNKSGTTGVEFNPKGKKFWNGTPRSKDRWIAVICIDGKTKYLGVFDCQWDAICARKSAEYRYGCSPLPGLQQQRS